MHAAGGTLTGGAITTSTMATPGSIDTMEDSPRIRDSATMRSTNPAGSAHSNIAARKESACRPKRNGRERRAALWEENSHGETRHRLRAMRALPLDGMRQRRSERTLSARPRKAFSTLPATCMNGRRRSIDRIPTDRTTAGRSRTPMFPGNASPAAEGTTVQPRSCGPPGAGTACLVIRVPVTEILVFAAQRTFREPEPISRSRACDSSARYARWC